METSTIKENKLKTILMFSVPSIIAMLLQTAITITDEADFSADFFRISADTKDNGV